MANDMLQKFLRVYKNIDIDEVKEHLLICGELSANCGKCNAIGLKADTIKCPKCQTDFQYLTFRNIRANIQKVPKISESNPNITIIDYDDYKKVSGAQKAQDFFK